ncbi:MAG: hypothetical protein H6563_05845 [Lewinellaceae bacterium]|nr:hypothetical protein [Lewinellaceae bacterium]
MKRFFRQIARFFIVLTDALSGKGGVEPLSHYPGTARFVGPWRRGAWAPTHPDAWAWTEEADPASGAFWYCERYGAGHASDVLKPRATRE